MERKFLVELQYDGRNFDGFQKNQNCKSIEEQIEVAIKKLFKETISIDACSRTDKGVSAEQFYFTFDVDTKLPADRVAYKLNKFLPKTIQCQNSIEVSIDFNLRKNIQSKTYSYAIYYGKHIQPLKNKFATYVEGNLDIQKIIDCSKIFVGKHNFKSFCNQNPDTTSFEREIFQIEILQQKNLVYFNFTADNFLYNMVRILAGTLVLCGKGELSKSDIKNLLQVKDRSKNPANTMPAKSLTLQSVLIKNLEKYTKI